jgi:hypothetical protein
MKMVKILKALITAILFGRITVSSKNTHNEGMRDHYNRHFIAVL